MRKSMLALALAATCTAPLQAQTLTVAPQPDGAGPVAMAGFAGARVRISLGGGTREDRQVRAGLTVAPMHYRGSGDFQGYRARIGEGFEFGFRGGETSPQLSLAGMRLTGAPYASRGHASGKGRSNLSGGDAGLIVVGVAALIGVGLLVALNDTKDDCTAGDCNNN